MTDAAAATGDLEFREAGTADVGAVVALIESAYRGDASRTGWTTEADLLGGQRTDAEDVRARLAEPHSVLLLAERGGELVACCLLQRREDGRAYFGMFSVRPTAQGGGLGKAVLAEAERRMRLHWGAERIEMTVIRQRTDLIAYYERRGFRNTGVTSPFPYGDERFGIPLRDDLEFTELVKDV